MLDDVLQGLQAGEVARRPRSLANIGRRLHREPRPATQCAGPPTECADDAVVTQHRRVHAVRDGAQLLRTTSICRSIVASSRWPSSGSPRRPRLQRELESQSEDALLSAVVKVAFEPLPCEVRSHDEASTGCAQVLSQSRSLSDQSCDRQRRQRHRRDEQLRLQQPIICCADPERSRRPWRPRPRKRR